LDETPTSNSVLEDYTDMEYLETYDHNHDDVEVEGDEVNCPTEDDVDDNETTNIYYLTTSSTHDDVSMTATFIHM